TLNYYFFAEHYVTIFRQQPTIGQMLVWELPYWLLWAGLAPVVFLFTRRLSGPDFDPGFVFVGYSLQPSYRIHELRHDLFDQLCDRLLPPSSGRGAEDLPVEGGACRSEVASDRSSASGVEDAASSALPVQHAQLDFGAA